MKQVALIGLGMVSGTYADALHFSTKSHRPIRSDIC